MEITGDAGAARWFIGLPYPNYDKWWYLDSIIMCFTCISEHHERCTGRAYSYHLSTEGNLREKRWSSELTDQWNQINKITKIMHLPAYPGLNWAMNYSFIEYAIRLVINVKCDDAMIMIIWECCNCLSFVAGRLPLYLALNRTNASQRKLEFPCNYYSFIGALFSPFDWPGLRGIHRIYFILFRGNGNVSASDWLDELMRKWFVDN